LSEDELRKKIADIKREKEEHTEEEKRHADEFLKRAYIAVEGEPDKYVDMDKIAQELGYAHHTLNDVLDYLEGKGFIEKTVIGSTVLTDDAVRYVERELM
jgi:DNA-binding MarR family transcriptional regulator